MIAVVGVLIAVLIVAGFLGLWYYLDSRDSRRKRVGTPTESKMIWEVTEAVTSQDYYGDPVIEIQIVDKRFGLKASARSSKSTEEATKRAVSNLTAQYNKKLKAANFAKDAELLMKKGETASDTETEEPPEPYATSHPPRPRRAKRKR